MPIVFLDSNVVINTVKNNNIDALDALIEPVNGPIITGFTKTVIDEIYDGRKSNPDNLKALKYIADRMLANLRGSCLGQLLR